jgi:hypothetical protein
MKTKKLICLVFIVIPIFLCAQWSNDPLVNTLIAGTDIGDQSGPKIAVDNSGSYYISSFVDVGPPVYYNVYMHKLDANGNKLWGEDGLLISNHNNETSLSDYSMITGQDNTAILVFDDIREGAGFNNMYAYRISPDGSFLWGNDGVELSNNYYYEYFSKAIVTENGNYIFAWYRCYNEHSCKNSVVIQKVSPDGELVWDNELEIINSDTTYWRPQLVPAENDNFIVVWFKTVRVGLYMYFNYIYAQKFDSDGNEVWPSIVPVCDLDTLANCLPFYIYPVVKSDNNNGFFVCWSDSRLDYIRNHTYVQYIDANGNTSWTENGLLASLNTSLNQVSPEIEYIPASDELYVFWKKTDEANFSGMFGQKFSISGQRMWSDTGQVFEPLLYDPLGDYCYINAKLSPENDILVTYQKDTSYIDQKGRAPYNKIMAMRVDESGQFVWEDKKIVMSSYRSSKIEMTACKISNNQCIAVWIDDRPDLFLPGKLYAQNIQLNGELGSSIGINDFDQTLIPSLQMYPNPFNPPTTISFSIHKAGLAELSIYNIKGQKVRSLFNEEFEIGTHEVVWDGTDNAGKQVSSGIYLYKLNTYNYSEIKKCVLLK